MLRLRQLRWPQCASGSSVARPAVAAVPVPTNRRLHRACATRSTEPESASPPAAATFFDTDGVSHAGDAFRGLQLLPRVYQESLTDDSVGRTFLVGSRDAWTTDRTLNPHLRTYIRDMHAALAVENTTKVFELFEAMKRDPAVPILHIEVFNALLQACAKLKQPEAAVATFDAIPQPFLRPNFFTYIYLIDALLNHHNLSLAFDFLVILHREFESGVLDSGVDRANATTLRWMHAQLLPLHIAFLEKTSFIGAGYHASNISAQTRFMETFLTSYMHSLLDQMRRDMGLVFASRAAHAVEDVKDEQGRPRPTPVSVSDATTSSSTRARRRQAHDVLTPTEVQDLLPMWHMAQMTLHALFAYATTRRDLVRATEVWEDLHSLRTAPQLGALVARERTLGGEDASLERHVSLLTSLARVHYDLDEVPSEDKPSNRELRRQRRHLPDHSLDSTRPKPKQKSIAEWHRLRERVYEEFWQHQRASVRARAALQAGMPEADANLLFETRRSGRHHANDAHHAAEHQQLLPPSHALARIAAHHAEPEDLENEVAPLLPVVPRTRKTKPETKSASDPELESIESLVDSLYKQNMALSAAQADSEPALRAIEGESVSEATTLLEAQYRESESDAAEREHAADLNDARIESLHHELEAGLADAHRRSDSLSDSLDRKMADAPSPPSMVRTRRSIVRESTLTHARGSHLMPPHEKTLIGPAAARRIHHLYRSLLANLLLYGGASSSGRVTPSSYRRNQELVHALYYDYLALDLPVLDPRVLMLAHISHAPPEFHARLVSDADWVAPRGANGLVSRLFGPFLVGPPHGERLSRTSVESRAERLDWFRRVWHAHHVHEWAVAARGSDLAFRKRTYRLIEELTRRGLPPQNARDNLLHFLVKCLAFTSVSSRPDGVESLERSFHWRRQNLYEADLVHIRRVLRALFSLMLNHGVQADVRTLNELVEACLEHGRVGEALTVLQHMRHTFHLQPDTRTTDLFLARKVTPNHAAAAQRMLADIDANMNEVIREATERPRALPRASTVDGGDAERALDATTQMVESFNHLLNQYVMAQDSGAGMLRVHERMFELGLRPNSRTLALSLEILLQTPNSVALGRARELFAHAVGEKVTPLASNGYLAQFVATIEEGRAIARDAEQSHREKEAEERASRLLSKSSSSVAAAAPAPVGHVLDTIAFDPLSVPVSSGYAVPFTYETWFGVHVTSRSWLTLIEAAEALGSWDDVWSLFRGYLTHITSLAPTDRRAKLFLNADRLYFFAVVVRALVRHTGHLDAPTQLWHLAQVRQCVQHFYTVTLANVTDPAGRRRTETRLVSFGAEDGELRYLLLPSEVAQLDRWLAALARGARLTPPPPNDSDDTAASELARAEQAMNQRRQAQQKEDGQPQSTRDEDSDKPSADANKPMRGDMSFL